MKNVLKNNKCEIEFDEDGIRGIDLTDQYNLPAFFSKSKRGIKKAFEKLEQSFSDNLGMFDCIRILNAEKIRTHSYCQMD